MLIKIKYVDGLTLALQSKANASNTANISLSNVTSQTGRDSLNVYSKQEVNSLVGDGTREFRVFNTITEFVQSFGWSTSNRAYVKNDGDGKFAIYLSQGTVGSPDMTYIQANFKKIMDEDSLNNAMTPEAILLALERNGTGANQVLGFLRSERDKLALISVSTNINLDNIVSALDQASADIANALSQIEDIQNDVINLGNEVTNLGNEVTNMGSEISDINNNVTLIDERLAEVEASIPSLEALDERITQNETDIQNINNQIGSLYDMKIVRFGDMTVYKHVSNTNPDTENDLEPYDVAIGWLPDGETFIPIGQYLGGDISDVENNWNTSPMTFQNTIIPILHLTMVLNGTYTVDSNIYPVILQTSVDGTTWDEIAEAEILVGGDTDFALANSMFLRISTPDFLVSSEICYFYSNGAK